VAGGTRLPWEKVPTSSSSANIVLASRLRSASLGSPFRRMRTTLVSGWSRPSIVPLQADVYARIALQSAKYAYVPNFGDTRWSPERLKMADEQYLTPAQVAEELQVTVVTVRRWIANRELRATKAGPRRWTIRRSDLDAFLAGGGRAGPSVEVSEDPSFSKHLVAPDER
jgi:excisionase family DNA binding protein